jgi:hypothetical protein
MSKILFHAVLLLTVLSLRAEDAQLEHARTVNLERAANLPNFVADEVAIRYKSRHTVPPQWQRLDIIESEIVVHRANFTRQHTTLNGKPWSKPNFPEFNWSVRFGYEVPALFSPNCSSTAIEIEGREEANGKQLLAYRFHSPPNGCFSGFVMRNGLFSATKRTVPARNGRFLIDVPGGNLIHYEEETTEFPKGFALDPSKEIDSWDYVKIGDASYLLPVSWEWFGGFTKEDLWHVTVEYKNHRHFESSTNVTFH